MLFLPSFFSVSFTSKVPSYSKNDWRIALPLYKSAYSKFNSYSIAGYQSFDLKIKPAAIKKVNPSYIKNRFTIPFTILVVTCPGLKPLTFYTNFLLLFFSIAVAQSLSAQYKVKGTVYDSSRLFTIELVTVQSTGGKFTMTDSAGKYSIDVAEKDSIWFSFLGKPTPKYPVLKIADVTQFDIALRLKTNVMKEVKIKTRNYKEDSLQNRRDYARAFNFRRPSLETMTSVTSSGVGFDVQEIIRLFQFRKNKSMELFRARLEREERDKYVDKRFNKALIKRLTGIKKEEELNAFINKYRPTFEFTTGTSDYEFQYYIKIAFEEFKKTALAPF